MYFYGAEGTGKSVLLELYGLKEHLALIEVLGFRRSDADERLTA